MRSGLKYFMVIGSLALGIALYGLNSASADQKINQGQYYKAIPSQAVITVDDQGTPVQNPNGGNIQAPNGQYAPYPYMMGPNMMWGNPNFSPNNGYLNRGWGMGMGYCW
ncbi:MAG: hypothetical protein FH758_10960 [Firmicutes bacterium]|nr:hypothetical protein [Bacillota bacterium]